MIMRFVGRIANPSYEKPQSRSAGCQSARTVWKTVLRENRPPTAPPCHLAANGPARSSQAAFATENTHVIGEIMLRACLE